MITLENLAQATEQEVFDQVAKHLITQNECSMLNHGCAYYGDYGLKCAAGCLIAASEYSKNMEGKSWAGLADNGEVPSKHRSLIQSLQKVHDKEPVPFWKTQLSYIGKNYGLNIDVLA